MFPIETISAKMLDYYVGRSDALIIDLRDAALCPKSKEQSMPGMENEGNRQKRIAEFDRQRCEMAEQRI